MSTGQHLGLKEDGSELRYWLEGRPVHSGNGLMVCIQWTVEDELPSFQLDLGGTRSKATFHLLEGARFRWSEQ